MKKRRITDLSHFILKNHVKSSDIIIDATTGNGYDTIFLSAISRHVYGFDIQEQAILSTKDKTNDITNITLIHDSFEHYNKHVKSFNGIIFNLGYLPNGDKNITTKKEVTLNTIKSLLEINDIFILITVYPGHPEGLLESIALKEYFSSIKTPVIKIELENRNNAPYIYFIETNKE